MAMKSRPRLKFIILDKKEDINIMKKRVFNYEFAIALILTAAGGFLEAYSLYYRGFWGMMMTGNIVYAMMSIVNGDFKRLLIYIPVIFLFAVGVFLARLIESKIAKDDKNKYQIIELAIIIGILLIVMSIPTIHVNSIHDADESAWPNILSNCLFAIGGGLLFRSFTTFGSSSYAPTTLTANLSRFAVSTYEGIFGPNKEKGRRTAIQYALLILNFVLSAAACYAFYYYVWGKVEGDLLISYFPNITLFIPLIIIVACLIMTIHKGKTQPVENL